MGERREGLVRARKAANLTQEKLAALLPADAKSVRAWESGRSEPRPHRRDRLARLLRISPARLEELLREGTAADRRRPPSVLLPVVVDGRTVALPLDRATVAASGLARLVPGDAAQSAVPTTEWDAMSPLSRRSLLKNGLPVAALPALGIGGAEHVARALENPRRYLDKTVTHYFRRQLDQYKHEDGERGPAKTLPMTLGVLDITGRLARDAAADDQCELLRIASEGAEFAGWLYRDRRQMADSLYWHDRAMEWAQAAGDGTMQGYILLKKAQVAYDERDPRRMLVLTRAVRNGPWSLPRRLQAEAAQQEARAEAMLGASADRVNRTLDVAWKLLDDAGPAESPLGAHFNATLLNMQTAICYTEAGEPRRSVELYEKTLKETQFSRRDYGFFLSLMANSLALSGEPDQAARTGLVSARRAAETNSRRTKEELRRVVEVLKPWHNRPDVRELREALNS
ncbi:helix-turn-helix domain-containing protein [Amycolatopsis orientalis]|uniref:helix-turn-helix domain-containing protein n=1 Tax=Amycolatopsis orientalis TaxID=31958 RepID=UPI0003AAF2A2|nr:helix-turn-helix domain-containing protein [Amycolatopsis orientalis]